MPPHHSNNASSGTSPRTSDSYALNLPEVPAGYEPSPPPTPEAQLAHASLLLMNLPADFWDKRRERMNPEPFRMD